ncbi:uncharacterized protein KY384_000022 [Bacidia gigantensis]|uniref:uncharacterized protein n=1 Tax=Bacidia gigantensis TaxID=2732470 RepID=UPI001D04E097|nr:uncharacterized protein KY384_000022 [Bacidia gigantensis]KAG8526429.1 hypothetical protein KY384_000022 [Bacidia gigantensis]
MLFGFLNLLAQCADKEPLRVSATQQDVKDEDYRPQALQIESPPLQVSALSLSHYDIMFQYNQSPPLSVHFGSLVLTMYPYSIDYEFDIWDLLREELVTVMCSGDAEAKMNFIAQIPQLQTGILSGLARAFGENGPQRASVHHTLDEVNASVTAGTLETDDDEYSLVEQKPDMLITMETIYPQFHFSTVYIEFRLDPPLSGENGDRTLRIGEDEDSVMSDASGEGHEPSKDAGEDKAENSDINVDEAVDRVSLVAVN